MRPPAALPPLSLLFPYYPGTRQVDEDFRLEAEAAKTAGFSVGFVDIEAVLGGEVVLRSLPESPSTCVYRGWILRQAQYERLEQALAERGHTLLNTSEGYAYASSFRRWYRDLEACTPKSACFPRDTEGLPEKLRVAFGEDASLMVKDYLKSRKQDWWDACFIPSSTDAGNIERVVKNFIDLQGDDFLGELVFRQMVNLRPVGTHPRSKMPLSNEYRVFLLDRRVIWSAPYWDSTSTDLSGCGTPDLAWVESCARLLSAEAPRLVTIDVAETLSGEWTVIEIGDGGVSGLPEVSAARALAFYSSLLPTLAKQLVAKNASIPRSGGSPTDRAETLSDRVGNQEHG